MPNLSIPRKCFWRDQSGVYAAALSQDINGYMRQHDASASTSWGTSRLMGSGTSDDFGVIIPAQ